MLREEFVLPHSSLNAISRQTEFQYRLLEIQVGDVVLACDLTYSPCKTHYKICTYMYDDVIRKYVTVFTTFQLRLTADCYFNQFFLVSYETLQLVRL